MKDENGEGSPTQINHVARSFFGNLIRDLVGYAAKFLIAFFIGTGAGAGVCLYYGFPLAFSLFGGVLVLGIALALSTESLFS